MTRIADELAAYDAIHRNPINRLIHAIGIPVIMFSVSGAAALVGQGDGLLNGGMVLAVVVGVILGRYDLLCGLTLTMFSAGLVLLAQMTHARLGTASAATLYGTTFVIGWSLQFVGHWIERAGPAFGRRPLNLLLGPVSVLNDLLPLVRPVPWKTRK